MSSELGSRARPEIEQTLAALVRAWDAGDASAYAQLFTEDASYVVFFGASYVGREAIERVHLQVFERYQRGSRMRLEIRELKLLTPDTAVVRTEGGIGKGKRLPLDKVQTFTLLRTATGWRIAAFQNTKKSRLFSMLGLFK